VRFLVEVRARPLRRSCGIIGLSRSAWYAPPLDWTVRDAEVIAALAQWVEEKPSRGIDECCQTLRKTHPQWNHKRIYRVYCEMRLNLRRAAARRLPKRERVPLYVPEHPGHVWSADFMLDALARGRPFRSFNIIDDYNREVIHIEIDPSITSARLVRIFARIARERPLPRMPRTDHGPEFLGEVSVQWAKTHGMAIRCTQPGKPNQNACIERFNRTCREDVLDRYPFTTLDHVRETTWQFLIDDNAHRPHDALGSISPTEYRLHHAGNSTYAVSA
jgi:putative transposase